MAIGLTCWRSCVHCKDRAEGLDFTFDPTRSTEGAGNTRLTTFRAILEVSGVGPDFCEDCEQYNGTFILDRAPVTSGNCGWRFDFDPSRHCMDGQFPIELVAIEVTDSRLQAGFGRIPGGYRFGKKIDGSDFDCMCFANLSLPDQMPLLSGGCDSTNATFLVTSVVDYHPSDNEHDKVCCPPDCQDYY